MHPSCFSEASSMLCLRSRNALLTSENRHKALSISQSLKVRHKLLASNNYFFGCEINSCMYDTDQATWSVSGLAERWRRGRLSMQKSCMMLLPLASQKLEGEWTMWR